MSNAEPSQILDSNPCRTASFIEQIAGLPLASKNSPNIPGDLEHEDEKDVKYPKRLRHKGKGRVPAGLLTKADGNAWFAVKPTKAANVITLATATRAEAHGAAKPVDNGNIQATI